MRSDTRIALLSASVAGWVLISLAGCPTRPQGPEPSAKVGVVAPPAGSPQAQRHEGRPFDVASRESLLTILAFRGGTLAKVGHNHVIASHDVSGTFYVPDDVSHSTFELHIPVAQLVIDEPDLRAKEGPDFPTDVPDSAKESTRRNMLSEALLNGTQYPDITLVSQHIDAAAPGSQIRADVQVSVRGQTHTVSVPVVYSLVNGELTASGDLPLKQSDLGLTPFSALLGALAVQDEMRVRFRFVAHESQTKGTAGS
ncbi:MAG TPA: YceI family protein [Steroidobacteraceae bacterium]|nr:YceI family protein [Steroidobacteraceae bacterium]